MKDTFFISAKLEVLKQCFLDNSGLHLKNLQGKVRYIGYMNKSKKDFYNNPNYNGDKIFKSVAAEEEHINITAAYRKSAENYMQELESEVYRLQQESIRLKKEVKYLAQFLEMEIQENIELSELYFSLMNKCKNESKK
jgi:hypothetical protein